MTRFLPAVCLLCGLLPGSVSAADPTEADYYKLIPLAIPEGVVLEFGAQVQLPEKKMALASRRGEIYIVEGAFDDPPKNLKFQKFAAGLHEVLGLAYKDGWIYATQRCELTKLKDENNDGRADLFQTVNDGWGINGDYHEYAFGSQFDKNGDIWIVLCLTGSFSSENLYRGWCLRVSPDGKLHPTCSGLRSPGGIGFNAKGDCFYTDNQGPWNGTCSLKFLKPGTFQGHPIGNRWYDTTKEIGPRPVEPQSGSRIMTEAKKIPEFMPPPVLFPYAKMGQSASGIACDLSQGKFGPFAEQLFVGDQTFSTVMRVFLEEVDGKYQGVCFPFREGFGSGSLSLEATPDGSLFVGGTNRGWGSRGSQPFAWERLVWTGKTPFEVHEMRAKPDGFELTFTQPVDPKTAADVKSYQLLTYTYIYQASYGSPQVDHSNPTITSARVAPDGKSVRLKIDGLQVGHVHELNSSGLRSAEGLPLLHPQAYYTLNYLPSR